LHRADGESGGEKGPIVRDEGETVGVWNENRVRYAFEAGEDVGTQVVNRADEVFVAHEEVGEGEAEEDGAYPCADEA